MIADGGLVVPDNPGWERWRLTCDQWTSDWRRRSGVFRTDRHGGNSWQRLRQRQAPEERFQFAKNNSTRFDSHPKIDSNRFNSAGLHSTVERWKVGEGRGQIDVLTLIFPAFVPAAVASTVQSQQILHIDSWTLWSNGTVRFFGKPNRFVKWIESNRFESRIGMH